MQRRARNIVVLFFVLVTLLLIQGVYEERIVSSDAELVRGVVTGKTQTSSAFMGQLVVGLNEAGALPSPELATKIERARLRNEDVVGWITVEDLNIDYPVLYSTDNKEYLRANIDKEYDISGCIYLDANYGNIYSPIKLIHGHNMKNGTKFGNLPQMLHWDSLDNAPVVTYCDDLGVKTFKIFSVFSVNSEKESVIISDYSTLEELMEVKQSYVDRSWAPVSEVPDGLEMLMLNTCWYGESGVERHLHCIVVATRIS